MVLFQSQENFAHDSVIVVLHKADPNYCYGQINWDIIRLHDFPIDPCSNLMGYLKHWLVY